MRSFFTRFSWRAFGLLIAILFPIGFFFGEGDWFGLAGRDGWLPALALRVVRGLASALIAPVVLGVLGVIHYFTIAVPLTAATRTPPATPRPDPDPIQAARQPRPTGRRRVLLALRRWLIGAVLFLTPIYAAWGLLTLFGVDKDTGASIGVAVTLVLWSAIAIVRRSRKRASVAPLRFMLHTSIGEQRYDFSCEKIAESAEHPRGIVVRIMPPIPVPRTNQLDELVAIWPATTGTNLATLDSGGAIEVMVGAAPEASRYTTRPWYQGTAASFADIAQDLP